jgi:ankyrin repeat protein
VDSLLCAGANPNFHTKESFGPVLRTILVNRNWWNNNTVELLTLLIKHKADVNFKDEYDGSSLLHEIGFAWTYPFCIEIAKLLISNEANIKARDDKGKTPYDNIHLSHAWPERKTLTLPNKLLDLLNPE